MNSSDSKEANVNRSHASQKMPSSSSEETSSGSAESSSDSGNAGNISTPPSIKPQIKSSPNNIRNNISTPSSSKRPREPQGKEVSKRSSKKSKKPAQEDNKGKTAGVSEAGKSAKRIATIWSAKDEAALLKRLMVFYKKGNGLPKVLSAFYEAVKNDLDGDYSNDQLYNKLRSFKAKFATNRDKINDKGFVGFKNSHEESLYVMSKQLWGNKEEEEGEKAGNGDNTRGEKKKMKKKKNVVDNEGAREEVRRNENEENENDDEEEGEGHAQDEQNANVNLSQQDALKEAKTKKRKEYGPSHVAGTGTQRSEARRGNREEEEGCSEKAGNGDNARGEKKKKEKKKKMKKNVVDSEGAREEVKMNKNEAVGMGLKEQEEEEEEGEKDDEEEGEGRDQDEQNVNVNLSQRDTLKEVKTKKNKEDVPSLIAGTVTQRSEVRRGDKEASSEEDVGEEQNSSDEHEESESESTGNENSAVPDSNAAVELSKSNIGGSSPPRNLNSPRRQTNGRENSTNHGSKGISKGSRRVGTAGHYDAGENSRQHVDELLSDRRKVAAAGHDDEAQNLAQPVPNDTAYGNLGMTDRHQMFDQLCKENSRIFQSQVMDMLDGFKNGILNIVDTVKKDLQGSNTNVRATGFDFSMTKGFSFGRKLPSLSKTEAETIDRKWQRQQFIEMEAASKHLVLLQEEYQLRLAKFRHQ